MSHSPKVASFLAMVGLSVAQEFPLSPGWEIRSGIVDDGIAFPICPAGDCAAKALAASDFDGDNKADLVVATFHHRLAFLRGAGDGTFAPSVFFNVTSLLTSDLNGDGLSDLVLTHPGGLATFLANTRRTPFNPAITPSARLSQPLN